VPEAIAEVFSRIDHKFDLMQHVKTTLRSWVCFVNGERESIQKVREILRGSFFFWATVKCHVLGGKAQSFNFKSDMLQLRNLEAAAHTIASQTYTLASRISNCTLLKIAGAKGSLLLYLHVNGTLNAVM